MKAPTTEEIEGLLINIISDGFNRSLDELRQVGVVDEKKLRSKYRGIGSEYYDRVTVQIELTARYAAPAILELFATEEGRAELAAARQSARIKPRKPWWKPW
jgi:hypothetical protein